MYPLCHHWPELIEHQRFNVNAFHRTVCSPLSGSVKMANKLTLLHHVVLVSAGVLKSRVVLIYHTDKEQQQFIIEYEYSIHGCLER